MRKPIVVRLETHENRLMRKSLLFPLLLLLNLNLALARQVLLEPNDGRVYHGAQTMTYESGSDPLAGYLGALNDPTIQPAIRGFFMSIPGVRGPDKSLQGLRDFFHLADSVGFVPELSLFFVSDVATDSVIAVSNQYDWIIDSVITLSRNYGKRMFLRIGGEFNGTGPGWNGGGYHPYLYVTMFRKIVDMFGARGLRDSIAVNWCYEPDAANDFDSVDARGARWFPGDSYVDWFGLDVFDAEHFDQSATDYSRGGITRKGKSERFLSLARAKGKPVFLSETSAKGINISNDANDGMNDWDNWFAKFWQFIDAHKEIKGFGYINAHWPAGAYPNWGDARIQNNQYVAGKYREEMRKSKYIHLGTNSITDSEGNGRRVLPSAITLLQNFPNPFNPTTTITYELPRAANVSLRIFDVLGREVATLANELKEAGRHRSTWTANVSSGIYFYRLSVVPRAGRDHVPTESRGGQAGSFLETRHMILLR